MTNEELIANYQSMIINKDYWIEVRYSNNTKTWDAYCRCKYNDGYHFFSTSNTLREALNRMMTRYRPYHGNHYDD